MVRKFLRVWFIEGISLALTGWVFNGIEISYKIPDLLLATLILTLVNKLVKPLLNLLLLPITIITLGFLKWIISVASLGITIYLLDSITLRPFHFSGFYLYGFNLPAFTSSVLISLLLTALIYEAFSRILSWIFKTR